MHKSRWQPAPSSTMTIGAQARPYAARVHPQENVRTHPACISRVLAENTRVLQNDLDADEDEDYSACI